MSFTHNKLVTHGIAITDGSQGPVKAMLFELKAFRESGNEADLTGTPLFLLEDINPEALNLLTSSVHLYQMVIRNMLGLDFIKSEIGKAAIIGAIGPKFATHLRSCIDQIQNLNQITETRATVGQEAADTQLTNGGVIVPFTKI